MTLAMLAFAALIGLVAIVDADGPDSALGIGAGTSVVVFIVGGTVVCALACLARRRTEFLALGALATAGLATDLLVLAIWREIDDETYAKVAGVAFVWTIFGLLMLGLTLAVSPRERLSRALYRGAMLASAVAGLIYSWLIVDSGAGATDSVGGIGGIGTVYFGGESDLSRPLAAALVLLSTLWFGALAASRLEQD
jgi:hypothetical protein